MSINSASEKPQSQVDGYGFSGYSQTWIKNPMVLMSSWREIVPQKHWGVSRNRNAIARLVIVLSLMRFAMTRSSSALWQGLAGVALSSVVVYGVDDDGKHTDRSPDPENHATSVAANHHDQHVNTMDLSEPAEVPLTKISADDELRLKVGSQANLGRQTFRNSNRTQIYSRQTIHSDDEGDIVAENTVGVGKFVSRFR